MLPKPLGISVASGISHFGLSQNWFSYPSFPPQRIDKLPVLPLSKELQVGIDRWKTHLEPRLRSIDKSVLQLLYLLHNSSDISTSLEAVFVSSSRGAADSFEQALRGFIEDRPTPVYTSPNTTLGSMASSVSSYLQHTGFSLGHSMACSSFLQGMCNASAWISSGMASSAMVAASEACITPFTVSMLRAIRIYSTSSSDFPLVCTPGSGRNNSMVLGDGAAVVELSKSYTPNDVLLTGIGWHMERQKRPSAMSSDGQGYYASMEMALQGKNISDVDMIIAHAPGTQLGDSAELAACKRLFTELPILYSNKWLFGHTLGASGGLSTVQAVNILKGESFPLAPFSSSFSGSKPTKKIRSILVNASGFGGNHTSILLEKR